MSDETLLLSRLRMFNLHFSDTLLEKIPSYRQAVTWDSHRQCTLNGVLYSLIYYSHSNFTVWPCGPLLRFEAICMILIRHKKASSTLVSVLAWIFDREQSISAAPQEPMFINRGVFLTVRPIVKKITTVCIPHLQYSPMPWPEMPSTGCIEIKKRFVY